MQTAPKMEGQQALMPFQHNYYFSISRCRLIYYLPRSIRYRTSRRHEHWDVDLGISVRYLNCNFRRISLINSSVPHRSVPHCQIIHRVLDAIMCHLSRLQL